MAKGTAKNSADQFIQSKKKWVRVLAGPGTGKSYSMKERLKHLVIDEKINGNEILVLTFTNVAVQDLKNDIEKLNKSFEEEGLGSIEVSTLHSLARKLLRNEGIKYRSMQDYEIETMLWDLEPEIGAVQKKKKMFNHCVKHNSISVSTDEEKELIASMDAWLKQHNGFMQDLVIPRICK